MTSLKVVIFSFSTVQRGVVPAASRSKIAGTLCRVLLVTTGCCLQTIVHKSTQHHSTGGERDRDRCVNLIGTSQCRPWQRHRDA